MAPLLCELPAAVTAVTLLDDARTAVHMTNKSCDHVSVTNEFAPLRLEGLGYRTREKRGLWLDVRELPRNVILGHEVVALVATVLSVQERPRQRPSGGDDPSKPAVPYADQLRHGGGRGDGIALFPATLKAGGAAALHRGEEEEVAEPVAGGALWRAVQDPVKVNYGEGSDVEAHDCPEALEGVCSGVSVSLDS